jgi:hypothetical protein
VISFKLCPISYDCEHCDLDKAMRSEVKLRKIRSKVKPQESEIPVPPEGPRRSRRASKTPAPFFTFCASEIKEGIYLHPAHLWARQMDDRKWRVGVDELLAYILPVPVKFEFSDLDSELILDQMFGRIFTRPGLDLWFRLIPD